MDAVTKIKQNEKRRLSLECVRDFLVSQKGKTKQTDLLNHFRSELNDPPHKSAARQEFKDILQLLTAVKVEDGK